MNTGIKLLNACSNSTRIRNCIEDYVASLHPFDLTIGWAMGEIDYKYPDKPNDDSTGYIAFNVSGKSRLKLKTTRYLTRKCKLNEVASLNDEQIRILAEKINDLLWTVEELNNVELICGPDITKAYTREVGGSSCMTGCNSDYTKLYEANPTRFQMLIVRNNNDSARAIIHKLDDGQKLLGAIYTTAEHLWDKMYEYASKQNWIIPKDSEPSSRSSWIMSGLRFCDGEIPYMDVLIGGKITGSSLTVSYNPGDFGLQNQNGYLESGHQCENCGDRVSEDNTYIDDSGNTYCEYCFNENFSFCPDCDIVVHTPDAIFIEDKEIYVCQHCADKNYHRCETCGGYLIQDNVLQLDDSEYCENCFDEIADYCENCNEAFHTEDLTVVNDSGLLCEECATVVQESEGVII